MNISWHLEYSTLSSLYIKDFAFMGDFQVDPKLTNLPDVYGAFFNKQLNLKQPPTKIYL